MNAVDVLKYGHLTVMGTIDGLPESEWETGGVCGIWSVKDIIAHLASYEHVLVDVIRSITEPNATTLHLARWHELGDSFNDVEVERRQDTGANDILKEYIAVQMRTIELIARVPDEGRRTAGTLPWYGPEYSLDDFIVYQYYGHKREHCAQINVFRDRLRETASVDV